MKMFDLGWYGDWEEGEDAPTRGKMCVFINDTRCVYQSKCSGAVHLYRRIVRDLDRCGNYNS